MCAVKIWCQRVSIINSWPASRKSSSLPCPPIRYVDSLVVDTLLFLNTCILMSRLFLIYCDPNYLWIGKTQYYCRDSEIMINGIVNPQTRLYMHTCQSDYNSIMCVYMYCSWIRCDSLTNYYVMIVLAFNFTPWCIRDSLLLSFGHEYLGTFMAALKRTWASFC